MYHFCFLFNLKGKKNNNAIWIIYLFYKKNDKKIGNTNSWKSILIQKSYDQIS